MCAAAASVDDKQHWRLQVGRQQRVDAQSAGVHDRGFVRAEDDGVVGVLQAVGFVESRYDFAAGEGVVEIEAVRVEGAVALSVEG